MAARRWVAEIGASLATSRVFVSSIGSRKRLGKNVRHRPPEHLLQVVAALRVAGVRDHDAAGHEAVADELEELARGQIEGDVRLAVGVDHDHVVAAR